MAMAAAAAAAAAVLIFLLPTASAGAASRWGGERSTYMKLYWHDVVSGPDPTTVPVAQARVTRDSESGFGAVVVIDDALTEGPDRRSSRRLGRAQGIYVGAGKDEVSLLMAMTFVFQGGSRYNGSTLDVMGHNAVLHDVREMAIVGGTGVFRMARGYAQARSYTPVSNKPGDATVEYSLFIKH
ncbi:hypothetical protein HU200_019770 [Digitaria exilis]|uniref:Dirigent protein n=1 Tax=Digitaria exilis TaxID=1010633 RepID=A0A835F2J7_9POAL|nr:hypothetical protein HU200_019770 [Digitaria exilis]CAB3463222.1 unnamed protein product [Digitaria exilis]